MTLGGFSTLLWAMAVLLFVLNVLITLSVEKNEFNGESALLILLMLFTYSKMWGGSGDKGSLAKYSGCGF